MRLAGSRRLSPRRTSGRAGCDPLALTLAAGAGGVVAARALLARLLLVKLRRDVHALSAGDYRPILANYAQHAVLCFNDGEHRWAGEHRGRAAIERFLQDFVAAGIEGEISGLLFTGPPWRMTLVVRFDDHAHDPAGVEIYRNRTVLLAHTRWGRIVRQEDFYEDSARIDALERRLVERGVPATR
jgi:ketosteroid isomerase-like protein